MGEGMTEHEVQQAILARLGAVPGLLVWRNNTGAVKVDGGRLVRFGALGSADVLGVSAPLGRLVALEVKSRAGRSSDLQARWGKAVADLGGVYLVVRSVDEAVAGLRAHGIGV